ncbi:MAG: winged helix-turn-helix transcriptional regulator [Propionibacteriaceae bacterium]
MAAAPAFRDAPEGCLASEVLNRIGDKWSVYAIAYLGGGTLRFSELRRKIEGISQRMLTVTLRALERDGLVARTVHPEIPPRVEYALTPLGRSLLDVVGELLRWSELHTVDIANARVDYDQHQRR